MSVAGLFLYLQNYVHCFHFKEIPLHVILLFPWKMFNGYISILMEVFLFNVPFISCAGGSFRIIMIHIPGHQVCVLSLSGIDFIKQVELKGKHISTIFTICVTGV